MRDRILIRGTLFVALLATACGGGDGPVAARPPPPPPLPPPQDSRIQLIEDQIRVLFAAADVQSAVTRFRALQDDVTAGRSSDAEVKLLDLVDFTLDRFHTGQLLDPAGTAPPTTEEAVADLVEDLFDFVGIPAPVIEPETLREQIAEEILKMTAIYK